MLPEKAITSHKIKCTRYNHKLIRPSSVKSRTATPVKTYFFLILFSVFSERWRENLTWRTNERHHFKVLLSPVCSPSLILHSWYRPEIYFLFFSKLVRFQNFSTGTQDRPLTLSCPHPFCSQTWLISFSISFQSKRE